MNKAEMGGFKFLDALAITFIVLKLRGVIDWSWGWVLGLLLLLLEYWGQENEQ